MQVTTFFFSSSLAVNALWHGPDNDIRGEKGGTQLNWPVPVKGQIITQNRKTQTRTTRKSPSQTCVSSPKQQSNKTNGAMPNKKHPKRICRKIQRHQSLYPDQKHAVNELTTTKQYQLMLHGHLYRVETSSLNSQKAEQKSESIVKS